MKYRIRSATFLSGEQCWPIIPSDVPAIRQAARQIEENGTRVTLVESAEEVVLTIHHGERP